MKNVRKIVYLTGTRAEYGLMKPTLRELNKRFYLGLIVTGTHLSKKYGYTITEIKKDRFNIVGKINLSYRDNDVKSMADPIGKLIPKITKLLCHISPDLVLVEGDRGEQLAMTISAATMNIPVAHTSGGVVSKSIDDSYRNAITKLAHLHLAPTEKAAKRISKMNEERWRIHVVGPPVNLNFKQIDIYKELGLKKNRPLILVLQHPVSTQFYDAGKQMRETMEAIRALECQTIVIYPNSDAGSEKIIKEIKKYENLPFIKVIKSLDNEIFMNVLASTSVMVGNSSAGIVEAPFFNLPVVNIGIRQYNREHGKNVINVSHKQSEIINAIQKGFTRKFRRKINNNPYKINGKTEVKIANIISKLQITPRLLLKEAVY